MSEKIEPALTPEEWATRQRKSGERLQIEHEGCEIPRGDRAAVAAFCLDGQPNGFTHRHLAALRDTIEELEADGTRTSDEILRLLHETADRIAALLPPRT